MFIFVIYFSSLASKEKKVHTSVQLLFNTCKIHLLFSRLLRLSRL